MLKAINLLVSHLCQHGGPPIVPQPSQACPGLADPGVFGDRIGTAWRDASWLGIGPSSCTANLARAVAGRPLAFMHHRLSNWIEGAVDLADGCITSRFSRHFIVGQLFTVELLLCVFVAQVRIETELWDHVRFSSSSRLRAGVGDTSEVSEETAQKKIETKRKTKSGSGLRVQPSMRPVWPCRPTTTMERTGMTHYQRH